MDKVSEFVDKKKMLKGNFVQTLIKELCKVLLFNDCFKFFSMFYI